MVFTTQVTVELSYILKDGQTGEELWAEKQIAFLGEGSLLTKNQGFVEAIGVSSPFFMF